MFDIHYEGGLVSAVRRHAGNWIIVGFLLAGAQLSSFAQPTNQSTAYPDIWGFDLPVAQHQASINCGSPKVSLYALPNGDLHFHGLYRENTRTADCRDGEAVFFFVDFFKQTIEFVTEEIFEEFSQQNRKHRITPIQLKQKLETSSGSTLDASRHYSPRESECRYLIDYWVRLVDAKGSTSDFRYLLQILDPPIRRHFSAGWCELDRVPEGEFEIRVISYNLNFFQLPDKTFLAWGEELPVIRRFTADLVMKYH
ncbi:MAG: hypothetical protein VW600_01425, partial [Ferrovibrio sp.]